MLDFLNPIKGFGVTFGTMFRKKTTEYYPEEKKQLAPRFHGRHQLNRHPDGLEKCIGCELCAWACPADAIYVEGADNTEEERYSPGERYGRVYQINYLRCILCGLCIEACPTRALTMTNVYELADDTREKLIYEKQDLLAALTEGMAPPPHAMAPGTTDEDYYLGRVTEADPSQFAPAPAVAADVSDDKLASDDPDRRPVSGRPDDELGAKDRVGVGHPGPDWGDRDWAGGTQTGAGMDAPPGPVPGDDVPDHERGDEPRSGPDPGVTG